MHPKALFEQVVELVAAVLQLDHPADAVVSRFLREAKHRVGPRERNTLAETAYTVLRLKPRLERLAKSGNGPMARRLAALGWAHAMPQSREFVFAALGDAEARWLQSCLAVKANDPDWQDIHRHNLPLWLATRLAADMGSEAEMMALAKSLLQPASLDLRVNTQLAKRDALLTHPEIKAWGGRATSLSPWGIRVNGRPALQLSELFKSGSVEVQDEGSQLLALLVDAKRGEMVTDFCAGAGGKTLALGAAMRNSGRLYAFDVSAHRLDALKPRLARSGLSNVHPVALAHERDERVKRLAGKMDRVLVDAPCSGLGTLRRNPDLKWRQSETGLAELQAKQIAILNSAARLPKSGGRLVYATCSLLNQENEAVAAAFEAEHPEFKRLDCAELLTQAKVAGGEHPLTNEGMLRLWPHRHGTDGFFAAVWQRS